MTVEIDQAHGRRKRTAIIAHVCGVPMDGLRIQEPVKADRWWLLTSRATKTIPAAANTHLAVTMRPTQSMA